MHPRKGRALAFRDLIAASHQFNAVSRSSLLLAEHPDDEARRALLRGKGNLANGVPALTFRIRSEAFELNGHRFNMPVAVDWKTSSLRMADLLPGSGNGGDDEERSGRCDKVANALTEEPQSVRDLAKATGVARSTVHRILHDELEPDGVAERVAEGWVSQRPNSRRGTVGHPPENGSTEPNRGVPRHYGSENGGTPHLAESPCRYSAHRGRDWAPPGAHAWTCGVCHPPVDAQRVTWRERGVR
jgi:hypothetical protein